MQTMQSLVGKKKNNNNKIYSFLYKVSKLRLLTLVLAPFCLMPLAGTVKKMQQQPVHSHGGLRPCPLAPLDKCKGASKLLNIFEGYPWAPAILGMCSSVHMHYICRFQSTHISLLLHGTAVLHLCYWFPTGSQSIAHVQRKCFICEPLKVVQNCSCSVSAHQTYVRQKMCHAALCFARIGGDKLINSSEMVNCRAFTLALFLP